MSIKVAFISDTHFGEGRGTERENDCWEAVEEALTTAQEMGCSLIVHAGDVFDGKLPRPEDWSRALQILSKNKIPMVAIHGNHERRGKGLINPVEALSRSGLFDYVNAGCKTYEVGGVRVVVHGIGWIPESYSKEVLLQWNPKPVEGAINVLVLHQSVHPFIYSPLEPPSLRLEDMPPGFDLYVNGHIHERQIVRVHGKPFVIVGSTVTTQVNKAEAAEPKGFLVVEFGSEPDVQTVLLKSARKVFYKEVDADGRTPKEIAEETESYLKSVLQENFTKKPLVRVRVKGKLPKGVTPVDVDLRGMREAYAQKCILTIATKLYDGEKPRLLNDVSERLSLDELGFKLLRDALKQQGSDFKFEEIFEWLVDGDAERALVALLSETTERAIEARVQAMGVEA